MAPLVLLFSSAFQHERTRILKEERTNDLGSTEDGDEIDELTQRDSSCKPSRKQFGCSEKKKEKNKSITTVALLSSAMAQSYRNP